MVLLRELSKEGVLKPQNCDIIVTVYRHLVVKLVKLVKIVPLTWWSGMEFYFPHVLQSYLETYYEIQNVEVNKQITQSDLASV